MNTRDSKVIVDIKSILNGANNDTDKVNKLLELLKIGEFEKNLKLEDFIITQDEMSERHEITMKVMESLMWWRRWNILGNILRPYSNEEIVKMIDYEHDILHTPSLVDNPQYTEDLPNYDGKTFTPCKNYAPKTKIKG